MSAGGILVRPLAHTDVTELAEIGLRAREVGIGPHVPSSVRLEFSRLNPFLPRLETGAAGFLVAIVADALAGLSAREKPDVLSDLWVDPGFHRRWVGKELLDTTIKHAAKDGIRVISLEVLSANRRAAAFYERNGFKVVWQEMRFDKALAIDLDKTGMERVL
jgi:ribosomal-protein-alanine N-acetyltransferase